MSTKQAEENCQWLRDKLASKGWLHLVEIEAVSYLVDVLAEEAISKRERQA